MTPQALAVGLILVLFVLVGVYLTRGAAPTGGAAPNVAAETYLYYDPENPSPSFAQAASVAAGYQGKVSTPGDLSYYASLGGTASWCGVTSTGTVYSVPGARYSPGSLVTSQPCCGAPYGVWVTGSKTVAGTKNVSPFNCESWYQPADHPRDLGQKKGPLAP